MDEGGFDDTVEKKVDGGNDESTLQTKVNEETNAADDAMIEGKSCPNAKNSKSDRICPGHERALPIQQTVMELDVKEEGKLFI